VCLAPFVRCDVRGADLQVGRTLCSLTDRYEEIVGSRVLEPVDYLVDNADPREVIAAGESFNAVFTIASPSVEATGFKLNVCYRQSDGQLRCALEDFK
jgi:hypothetical protein